MLPEAVRHLGNPRLSWWPASLSGDLDPARLRKEGYAVGLVAEPDIMEQTRLVVFIVNWAQGRAFFYRPAGD